MAVNVRSCLRTRSSDVHPSPTPCNGDGRTGQPSIYSKEAQGAEHFSRFSPASPLPFAQSIETADNQRRSARITRLIDHRCFIPACRSIEPAQFSDDRRRRSGPSKIYRTRKNYGKIQSCTATVCRDPSNSRFGYKRYRLRCSETHEGLPAAGILGGIRNASGFERSRQRQNIDRNRLVHSVK